MAGNRFLVVEFEGSGLAMASFTQAHPGTRIDIISEPTQVEGADKVHPSVVLVKGAQPPALEALLANLAKVYDPIHTIERDDARRVWLGRVRIRESALHNAAATIVTRFNHRFGVPWTHLEDGVLYMRARVDRTEEAELLADQMRRFFQQAGVDAQVDVQEISPRDYGVWQELIQHAIGLAP